MKLASQLLTEYLERYPIYKDLLFSEQKSESENLPALFVLTQHIIDSFVTGGIKRIAIILPDNDCGIIPLVLAKCLSNIQHEHGYTGSVLDDAPQGQRLRLGDAVVEFVCVDREKNIVTLKVGREAKIQNPQPMTIMSPIRPIHNMLEKTEGAITSYDTWLKALKKASQTTNEKDILNEVKLKRTAVQKTILLLSTKNDFREFADSLYVNGSEFQEVVSYGEIDDGATNGFNLFNKGRLDCLPAIAVSTKMEEIYTTLKKMTPTGKIATVFSTSDKFNELVSAPATLMKCLRYNVPFVVFVPESAFEECPQLIEIGFEIWHWKPSMMRSEVFLTEATSYYAKKLFGKITAKATQAAIAEFDIKKIDGTNLKSSLKAIRQLADLLQENDSSMKKLLSKIWSFQFRLASLLCPISEMKNRFVRDLEEVNKIWQQQRVYYNGQETEKIINMILQLFGKCISDEDVLRKSKLLAEFLSALPSGAKATIIVSDKYEDFLIPTKRYISEIKSHNSVVRILTLSEFYAWQDKRFEHTENLVVTWFDKDEYIKIRQTYCYDKLSFLLYDFENKWRDGYVSRMEACLPHAAIAKNAERIGFSQWDFSTEAFDAPSPVSVDSDSANDYKEIEDFNIGRHIVRSFVRSGAVNENASDSAEAIPVLLSGDRLGYFWPTREIIEVSGLISGDSSRPLKREAQKLRKGDRILIRLSERDITKEKADEMMAADGKIDLRDTSSIWNAALAVCAEGKSLGTVRRELKSFGGECTEQQIRYWLAGETICPTEKAILSAILNATKAVMNIDDVEAIANVIFQAAREVRGYHVSAGFWLSKELKSKAAEIKEIIRAGGAVARGKINSIGEICIYTVEDVLDKEFISRGKLNKVEALF